MRAGIDRRAMTLLSGGHLGTDFAGGALPALLPYFKDRFSLSYTAVAALMLCSTVASSIIQPAFGLFSDRRGALWLAPAGCALAGVGIALAADAPSYSAVLVLAMVSGLGVAAFHPEGSKFAAYVSGRKRASGMAAFSIGGNLGYALGPIGAGLVVAAFGLRGGLLLALPGLAIAAVLVATHRYLGSFAPGAGGATGRAAPVPSGERQLRALVTLLGVIALRSFSWFGLITFVPLWEVTLGHSKSHGTHLLSLMLLVGVIGTVVAGPLADRIGPRPVLMASMIAVPPLLAAFVVLGGPAGAVCLALVGACVIGTFGVTMVMAQEYLPDRIGMASGLSIGFSIGLGGIGAVLLGAIADSVDLRAAMWVVALVPVLAIVLGARLPSSHRERGLRLRTVGEA
jgi:FSR family fosmidomycin resistance protein-like MFS transporter